MRSILLNTTFIASLSLASPCFGTEPLKDISNSPSSSPTKSLTLLSLNSPKKTPPSPRRLSFEQEERTLAVALPSAVVLEEKSPVDEEALKMKEYKEKPGKFLWVMLTSLRKLQMSLGKQTKNLESHKATLKRSGLLDEEKVNKLLSKPLLEVEDAVIRTFLSFYGCVASSNQLCPLMMPTHDEQQFEIYKERVKKINATEFETIYPVGSINFLFKEDILKQLHDSFQRSEDHYRMVFEEAAAIPFKSLSLAYITTDNNKRLKIDFFTNAGLDGKYNIDKVRKIQAWTSKTISGSSETLQNDSDKYIYKLRNESMNWSRFVGCIIGLFSEQDDEKTITFQQGLVTESVTFEEVATYIVDNIKVNTLFQLPFKTIILTSAPTLADDLSDATQGKVKTLFGPKAKLATAGKAKQIEITGFSPTFKDLLKPDIVKELKVIY